MDIHAGHESRFGSALLVDALIGEADADNGIVFSIERLRSTGMPGQICTMPEFISCLPTHWLNWPNERMNPSCFVQELRRVGKFDSACLARRATHPNVAQHLVGERELRTNDGSRQRDRADTELSPS